ncbi:MAG: antibiotic biosynthesis monooxygenase [Proteobacteria bacterium]|nr:antibiotic biosynthesis monooxygenase [Pseudomonadota bacterium]
MFAVLVELNAKPLAVAELADVLSGLADIARDEADNLIYAVHRQQANEQAFVLYELYRDCAAWQAHLAIDAVQRALQQFENLLTAAPRIVHCDSVALAGVEQAG